VKGILDLTKRERGKEKSFYSEGQRKKGEKGEGKLRPVDKREGERESNTS
jgi:hypothetical protein